MAHCSVRIIIDELLKLQSEKCLNSPPNKKLRIPHKNIPVHWKKYEDGEIGRLEYVNKFRLKIDQFIKIIFIFLYFYVRYILSTIDNSKYFEILL